MDPQTSKILKTMIGQLSGQTQTQNNTGGALNSGTAPQDSDERAPGDTLPGARPETLPSPLPDSQHGEAPRPTRPSPPHGSFSIPDNSELSDRADHTFSDWIRSGSLEPDRMPVPIGTPVAEQQ
jgi:hypothetical protein